MVLKHAVIVILSALVSYVCGSQALPTSDAPIEHPQPVYLPQDNYVPHATYPYSDTYPGAYDGYLVPAGSMQYPYTSDIYSTSLEPKAQSALQVAFRAFARLGLFLMGGVALLVVGGLFTTVVCSLTPFCTITFAGFNNINKETVRSLVNPDSLSSAANFVQNAIGKYQRLQKAAGNQ